MVELEPSTPAVNREIWAADCQIACLIYMHLDTSGIPSSKKVLGSMCLVMQVILGSNYMKWMGWPPACLLLFSALYPPRYFASTITTTNLIWPSCHLWRRWRSTNPYFLCLVLIQVDLIARWFLRSPIVYHKMQYQKIYESASSNVSRDIRRHVEFSLRYSASPSLPNQWELVSPLYIF